MAWTLLNDHTGKASTSRAVSLWIYLVFGVCWCWASIRSGTVAEVPDTALFLLALASGQQQGGKYLTETKPSAAKESTDAQ